MSTSGPEEYHKISKVTPVGEKEHEQEMPEPTVKPIKKKLSFLYQIVQVLLSLFPRGSLRSALKDLDRDLRGLKALFLKLQVHDLSEDSTFLEELKQIWEGFIKHFQTVSLSTHPLLIKTRTLFDDIHSYPNAHQFSLGYYLSHYAGEAWLPFPYIEMLKNLHAESLQNKENNTLGRWIQKIDEIILVK